jgi:hypothetical protein
LRRLGSMKKYSGATQRSLEEAQIHEEVQVGDTEVTRRGSCLGGVAACMTQRSLEEARMHEEMCKCRGRWKKHADKKICDMLRKEKLRNIILRS